MAFKKYPELFIDKVLKEIATEYTLTIEEVLQNNRLTCLISRLSEVSLNKQDIFNMKTLKDIEKLIYLYKGDIEKEFSEMRDAAKEYWKGLIKEHKDIALVDIGRKGTCYLCLDYFLNEECGYDINIFNLQMLTMRDTWNDQKYEKRKMLSYCCSPELNPEIYDIYNHDLIRIFIMELMFSSCDESVTGYSVDGKGKVKILYAPVSSENKKIISGLHEGIMQYAEEFNSVENNTGLTFSIAGNDAIAACFNVKDNKSYIYKLFGDYKIRRVTNGIDSDICLKEYFKGNGY